MSAISILFLLNSTAVHPGPFPPGEREKRIEDCDPTNNFGMHPSPVGAAIAMI